MKTAVFDSRWILEKPSGIGVYALELARRLPSLLPGWRFVFLAEDEPGRKRLVAELTASALAGGNILPVGYGPLSLKNQLRLPGLLRELGADLFHAPNYMIPFRAFRKGGGAPVRCVATIHDVIPLVVPGYAPHSRTARMKPLYKWCLRQAALRSDALFTVSENSRRDILRSLALPESAAARVRAVHNGVDAAFGVAGRAPVRSREDPAERILLYVGRCDPYKNVPMLVEAFAATRAAAPFPMKLVVAGPRDDRYPEAERKARELGVGSAVQFAGSLRFKELVELYRRADLLVHPSRYEGFGLQIAEAFASGLPVLCTDGGAAPEIAGGAAHVVPLSSGAAGFSAAMLSLLLDPPAMARLRDAGLRRAAAFTWDRAAEAVAEAYR